MVRDLCHHGATAIREVFSTAVKFVIILIFLTLFTGVLGIFVTLTTLFNFVTCMATLTLLNYKLTVENMSYFVIVLIICSQYSVLYSIR
jgi:predicted RND superfamily exporter protein